MTIIETPETSRATVERYVDTLQRGDEQAIRSSFAADAEWH